MILTGSRRIRITEDTAITEAGWFCPKAIEAEDPNFEGSPIFSFSLLCSSLFFLFLAPSHNRSLLTLAPGMHFIQSFLQFTSAAKKLKSNSGKHAGIGIIYPQMDKENRAEIKISTQCCRYTAENPTTVHSYTIAVCSLQLQSYKDRRRVVRTSPIVTCVRMYLKRWEKNIHKYSAVVISLTHFFLPGD